MLIPVHAEITSQALGKELAPQVLEVVIQANKKQDWIMGQIGHSEFHFDNDQISEGQEYLQKQREAVFTALDKLELISAWMAFGRLIHTAQDFYAHSNYVSMWLKKFEVGAWPLAAEIDPMDGEILFSGLLRSGKLYYPLELLSFIPWIKKLVTPLLPKDSHARMNLDGPASGEKFAYAYFAAVKRTAAELELIKENLTTEAFGRFVKG